MDSVRRDQLGCHGNLGMFEWIVGEYCWISPSNGERVSVFVQYGSDSTHDSINWIKGTLLKDMFLIA